MPRDTKGYTIKETWDVMGMRATRSDDTILDGAFVPDKYIARVVPDGFAGADYFVLAIFAWALPVSPTSTTASPAASTDLTIEHVKSKGSLALTRSMAWHPEVQHDVAEMVMELEAIGAQIETVTTDWSDGVQHPDWPIKIVAAKYRAVEGAWRIVDRAMDASGGFGMFKKRELERLFRDCACGPVPPRQLRAVARSRRESGAGTESGRTAALGVRAGRLQVSSPRSGTGRRTASKEESAGYCRAARLNAAVPWESRSAIPGKSSSSRP